MYGPPIRISSITHNNLMQREHTYTHIHTHTHTRQSTHTRTKLRRTQNTDCSGDRHNTGDTEYTCARAHVCTYVVCVHMRIELFCAAHIHSHTDMCNGFVSR